MAVANTARLTLTGTLPAGEIFSTGVWLNPVTIGQSVPTTNAQASTWLNAITGMTEFTAMLTAMKAQWSTATGVTGATLASYPTGGSSAVAAAQKAITGAVGAKTTCLPNQVSRVITTQTGQAGRSFRGRMYLPADGETMSGATGHFALDASTLLSSIAAWMTALKTLTISGLTGGVFAIVASDAKSAATSITSIRTDNIPDIQRRRANRETGKAFQSQAIS